MHIEHFMIFPIGIPSTPQLISVSSTGLIVRVLITTAYTGVPAGDNSLHINIFVYNNTRGLLYRISLYSSPLNLLGVSASLSHEIFLQPGSYQFSATAGNRYGSSPESELTPAAGKPCHYCWTDYYTCTVAVSVSTLPIIVGVSVSSAVVIVILAVSAMLVTICCCIYNMRGRETTKCE